MIEVTLYFWQRENFVVAISLAPDLPKQFCWLHGQRLCEFIQPEQGEIDVAIFDLTEI